MSVLQSRKFNSGRTDILTILLIAGVVWLIVTAGLWWQIVYKNPKNVFNDMLANNFSTLGYTREVRSTQNNVKSYEIGQIQHSKDTVMRVKTTLKQDKDEVVTDAISTPNATYVRYLTIYTQQKGQNGKPLDFSRAVNVWSKSETSSTGQSIAQATLGTFPMGSVTPEQRNILMHYIHNNKVYTVDYKKVKKQQLNGRQLYVYPVRISPKAYISLLKLYAPMVGLGNQVAAINTEDYSTATPIDATVSIDPLSRHIVKLSYQANPERMETYGGYGIIKIISLPEHTITSSELQKRLNIL